MTQIDEAQVLVLLHRRQIEHVHSWGGQQFLIKKVGAEVCVQCGEAFQRSVRRSSIARLLQRRFSQPEPLHAVLIAEQRVRDIFRLPAACTAGGEEITEPCCMLNQ